MSKKLIVPVVLVLILLATFLVSVKYPGLLNTSNWLKNAGSQEKPLAVLQAQKMSGFITKVDGNIITIEGVVRYIDLETSRQLDRTIKFQTNSATTLKRKKITVTPDQLKAGSNLMPKFTEESGNVADLKVGTRVIEIVSNNADLFAVDSAVANVIYYAFDDYASSL